MDYTCFLCSNVIKTEIINLKNKKTNLTNIDLLEFIQNIAPNTSLIEYCDENICHLCFDLINDLDFARKQCLDLTNLLLSYLDNTIVQNVKTETKENFIQPDLLCDSIIIKEEIDIGDYQICHLENVLGKIDSISSDSAEAFDQNDSEKNVWISDECNFCQKSFNSLTELALHIRKWHQDDNIDQKLPSKDNIVDPICPEYGNVPQTNISEKKTYRKGNNCPKLHKCEQCGKAFKTSYKLKRHIPSHTNSKPHVCETCGLSYKHKAALDVHIGMHNGINLFSCIYCNKTFTQKKSLQIHMPLHTGECQHQCDICGKRFVHRNSFRFHLASHSENKSFKCEVCGAVFNSASHLKRHLRVHTGEKKFECLTCDKKFAERYNLIAHMKIHEKRTNANKHICEICNMSFERLSKLKKHKIAKHQIVDFFTKSDE